MTPSLEGWPTKAKEAPSPHEVRLAPLDTNSVFHSLLILTWLKTIIQLRNKNFTVSYSDNHPPLFNSFIIYFSSSLFWIFFLHHLISTCKSLPPSSPVPTWKFLWQSMEVDVVQPPVIATTTLGLQITNLQFHQVIYWNAIVSRKVHQVCANDENVPYATNVYVYSNLLMLEYITFLYKVL